MLGLDFSLDLRYPHAAQFALLRAICASKAIAFMRQAQVQCIEVGHDLLRCCVDSTVEHCSHPVQVKTLMQSDARCAKLCSMKTSDIRARLTPLRTAELERLSELSGVSLRTLWGIRSGKTETASESTKEKLIQGFKHMPRRARKGEK